MKYKDLLPASYLNHLGSSHQSSCSSRGTREDEEVLHPFFSPSNENQAVFSRPNRKSTRDTDLQDKSVYLSPGMYTAVSSLGTPFSKSSHRSASQSITSSIRDPQPYRLQNIRASRSILELEEIISNLRETNSFPALIKSAERRIEELRLGRNNSSSRTLHPVAEHDHSRRTNDDSIKMSLSPDSKDSKYVGSHRPSSPVSVIQSPRTKDLQNAQAEISRLVAVILELEENRAKQDKVYLEKISRLEQIRIDSEAELASLHDFRHSHSKLLLQLESYRDENSKLHNEIIKEREHRVKMARASQELERRLSLRIQELAKEGARLKSQNQNKSQNVDEIQKFLHQAQEKFRLVREERNKILGIVLEAMGKAKDQASQMTETKRLALVKNFVSQLEVSRQKLRSVSEELEKSRAEAQMLRTSRKKAEVQVVQYKELTRKLQDENKELLENVYKMTSEMKSHEKGNERALANATKQYEKKWEEEREELKSYIKLLRKRLAQNDKMVSFDIYKSAVNEVKSLRSKVAAAGLATGAPYVVGTVTENAASNTFHDPMTFEATCSIPILTTKESTEIVPPTSAVRPRRVKFEREAQNTPVASKADKENKMNFNSVKTPPPPPPPPPSRPPSIFSPGAGKTPTRATLVRAAGGRKALQQKLRDLRSPPVPSIKKPLSIHN